MTTASIIIGDVRAVLGSLPERSVQLCITSPPYWGLRSYLPADHAAKALEMGSEPTPEAYIAGQVEVFRAVRRVLRDDGVLVVNYGDSYAQSEIRFRNGQGNIASACKAAVEQTGRRVEHGLKPKDLVGIPWRVALALQADGWYLRSAMPWVKRSAMPESVTDRPASAVEYVFLLAKGPKYYWDVEAVRTQAITSEWPGIGPGHAGARDRGEKYEPMRTRGWAGSVFNGERDKAVHPNRGDGPRNERPGRNWRNADLWFQSVQGPHGLCGVEDELVGLDVTAEPSREEHFAAYPSRLVEPFVKAGTSDKGCCHACGKPWERMVERKNMVISSSGRNGRLNGVRPTSGTMVEPPRSTTVGWQPACDCPEAEPVPCAVLDPFSGTGTTGVVACRHGRYYIGIELSEAYAAASERRIERALKPQTHRADVSTEAPLFTGGDTDDDA